jgi:hypothetical protein
MTLLDRRFLRLVALVAIAGCGKEDPMNPGTGGTGGGTGGAGGSPAGGTGGGTGGSGGGGGTGGAGGSGGAPDGGSQPDSGTASTEYFPFKTGNTWTFDITEPATPVYRKEQVVVGLEPVGGTGPHAAKQAYRVETRKYAAGSTTVLDDATISWQLREGNKIVRYRETSCTRGSAMVMNGRITTCTVDVEDHWDPPRQRIDERPNGMAPTNGLSWPETYREFKKNYNYAVNPPAVTMTMADNTDTWTIMDANATVTVPAGTFSNCLVVQKRTSVAQNTKTYSFCRGVGKVQEVGLGQREDLAIQPTVQ